MRIAASSLVVAITITALLLVACSSQSQEMPPRRQFSPNERIAFISNRNGNDEIYAMNADGSGVTRLTNSNFHGDVSAYAWSPDGRSIAFASGFDRNYWIYAMDSDGSAVTPLSDYGVRVRNLAWSPRGRGGRLFIAVNDMDMGIDLLNSDGSVYRRHFKRRTSYRCFSCPTPTPEKIDNIPIAPPSLINVKVRRFAWSPSDWRIAFSAIRYGRGNSEIYAMNPDGTNLVQLTNNDTNDEAPSWSPDGQRIAFISYREENSGISLMNADGSEVSRIVIGNGPLEFAWSPDSRRIAFSFQQNVHVMSADGPSMTQLTDNDHLQSISHLAWSPNGRRIAFSARNQEEYGRGIYDSEIYVINADGSGITRLTNNDANDFNPSWRPAP